MSFIPAVDQIFLKKKYVPPTLPLPFPLPNEDRKMQFLPLLSKLGQYN